MLIQPLNQPPMGSGRRPSDGHQGIEKSLRFLWRYWREPIRVADLARVAGMSRRGFHKAFTRYVGRSPGRELRRLRISGSMKLLARSKFDAQTIAARSGYEKLNSFYVAFKRAAGLTPIQFRDHLNGRRTDRVPASSKQIVST